MYELYQTTKGSRGSLAEVWIDKAAGLTKKYYKPQGVTIRGTPSLYAHMDEISRLYHNEIYWFNKLKGRWVLEIYEHGELQDGPGYYLIQRYANPDLLHFYDGKKLHDCIPNPASQLVEMFKFFKDNNLYKLNNAMCNLTQSDGIIMAFDFKYAVDRTEAYRDRELYSINTWLAKIDDRLPAMLLPLL